ncbi:hypothetical protein AB1A82_01720 [Bdellovibrio bacteriovorus]|uniref:Uncharacterized protein n=2 Tax=Bdellovibrio bacteriovorus TaxID=959 RepID=Q6MQT9_BDEBA|nr:hypothetical protein [Bdellovibrio bacteriovorus]CAE78019.1 hypothetical protein predicted by Glimmer/Critica [Bdellovibrio bacteriovorus HD100]
MGFLLKATMTLLTLTLSLGFEQAEAAITRETDFVTPAEPMTVLRSSVVPCYGRNQAGVGRRTNMSYVEGERCSVPQPAEARRLDRPDHEVDDPGRDFRPRAL